MQGPYDIRIIHPSTHLVVGATGSGKTQYIKQLLERRKTIFNPAPRKIIMFFAQWQTSYESMKQSGAIDEFYLGLPDQTTFNNLIVGESTIVLFDDLFHAFGQNTLDINLLFKVQSHHENCSPFIIIHRAFGSNIRDLSLNCLYYHQLFSPRDIGQLSELSRQAFGRGGSNFLPACIRRQAQLRNFAHLMINFNPKLTNNVLMVLSNIFRENSKPITVYSRINSTCRMTEDYRELYLIESKEFDILRRKSEGVVNPTGGTVNQISTVLNNSTGMPSTDDCHSQRQSEKSVDQDNKVPPPQQQLAFPSPINHNLPQPVPGGEISKQNPQPGVSNIIPPITQLFNKNKNLSGAVPKKPRARKTPYNRKNESGALKNFKPLANNIPLPSAVRVKTGFRLPDMDSWETIGSIEDDSAPPPVSAMEPSLVRAKQSNRGTPLNVSEVEAPRGGKYVKLRKDKRPISLPYFEHGLKRRKKNDDDDVDN